MTTNVRCGSMRLAKRRSSTRRAWSPRPGAASTASGPRNRRSTSACGACSSVRCRASPRPCTTRSTTPRASSTSRSRRRGLATSRSSARAGSRSARSATCLAHTYDINLAVDARAATQIEDQAVRWVSEFVGFPSSAGAFTSGGTVSNVTALAAARERALPGSRHEGLAGRRAAVYCSQEVHYSVTRAVELLGIGSANLRAVAIDGMRRMQPDALADAIASDVAAGITPGRGGRDRRARRSPARSTRSTRSPTSALDHGVWLHVDGAYGLPAATTASRARDVRRAGARR